MKEDKLNEILRNSFVEYKMQRNARKAAQNIITMVQKLLNEKYQFSEGTIALLISVLIMQIKVDEKIVEAQRAMYLAFFEIGMPALMSGEIASDLNTLSDLLKTQG